MDEVTFEFKSPFSSSRQTMLNLSGVICHKQDEDNTDFHLVEIRV